jgi:hypothetical protein
MARVVEFRPVRRDDTYVWPNPDYVPPPSKERNKEIKNGMGSLGRRVDTERMAAEPGRPSSPWVDPAPDSFKLLTGTVSVAFQFKVLMAHIVLYPRGGLVEGDLVARLTSFQRKGRGNPQAPTQLEKAGWLEPRGRARTSYGGLARIYWLTEGAARFLDERVPGIDPTSTDPTERWDLALLGKLIE